MGFLNNLRNVFGGKGRGGGSRSGRDPGVYWVYAKCRRCGEPLKTRVNLYNDLSLDEDGEGWVVRKRLSGSGSNFCFQAIDVTLRFDPNKSKVLSADANGGTMLTAEEYQAMVADSSESPSIPPTLES